MLMRELPLLRCVLNWNVDTFNVLSWQHFLIAFIAFSVSYGKRVQCEAKRKCHLLSARRIERRGCYWFKSYRRQCVTLFNIARGTSSMWCQRVSYLKSFERLLLTECGRVFVWKWNSLLKLRCLCMNTCHPLSSTCVNLKLWHWWRDIVPNYIFLFTCSIAYTLIGARQQFAVARSILLWEDDEEIASAMRQYCMRFTSDDDIK